MRLNEAEDLETRNDLIVAHMGLVKVLASRLARRVPAQVEIGELVSAGVVGLVDAATRYRPSLGVPFSAFARRRVHGAMLDSLRELDWAPRSVRKMRRDIDAAVARARYALHREPTDREVAEELSVSETEYRKMSEQVRALDVVGTRDSNRHDAQAQLFDGALDPEENAYERVERAELRAHLSRAILELPPRDRQVLSLYYEHELTLAEIGVVLGVGESRVCQLRTQATTRLRTRLRQTLQLGEPR
jgi:RNA polymerase sigma factor for flagellar operon FliA